MSSFALHATEFDVIWRAQGHGRPPAVLDMPSPGATYTERARIEHEVWAALTERGLATGHGEPTPALQHALDLIVGRTTALELHTTGRRALLARANRRALLVEFDGEHLQVQTVADTGLAYTIVDLLPPLPAGAGQSITVDAMLLAKVEDGGTQTERRAILQHGGMPRNHARTLVDMISDAAGHGQIVGEVVERGTPRRSEQVVAFFHNPTGRYRVLRRVTMNGDHVTITPTTLAQLAGAASELISERP